MLHEGERNLRLRMDSHDVVVGPTRKRDIPLSQMKEVTISVVHSTSTASYLMDARQHGAACKMCVDGKTCAMQTANE